MSERETPLLRLVGELTQLTAHLNRLQEAPAVSDEEATGIARLREQAAELRAQLEQAFGGASAWERVQLARHEQRPYTLDYIEAFVSQFAELHGDRAYGDDGAVVAGLGWIQGRRVAVVGHQKGRTARERRERNFGMPRPEGFRKAVRVMQLAAKFGCPIVSFVDTPGADCLEEAEGRGISEAIAASQRTMFELGVPIVVVVIGEGGSGGAIGIGVGDRVFMLEHAYYAVITPEACAAILWRSEERAAEMATALCLTAEHALRLGAVDAVIEEPALGAQCDPLETARRVEAAVVGALEELSGHSPAELRQSRYEKFRRMGCL